MGEHRRRDREPELLGCLEVDHQLNLPWAEITGAAGTAGLFFIRPSRRAGKSGASRERRIPRVSSPSASCSAGHYNRAGGAACGYKAARPTTGGNGEGPKPTHSGIRIRRRCTASTGLPFHVKSRPPGVRPWPEAEGRIFVGRPASRRESRSTGEANRQTLAHEGDRAAARSHAQARRAEHGERG